MQTITLSRSDAKNYADLVFGEWPAHRRFGHQAGSMPEWQQMALIKEIRDGTTITNLQIFHDGAWAHPPRDLPFALDEAIDDVAQQARAHAQELSVIFTVERATRTMQLRLVTGNEALPWFLWRQVPERLDALFGRTRDLTAGTRPISLEDNHLRGTTVCLASNTTTPFTVISSAPSVTRELTARALVEGVQSRVVTVIGDPHLGLDEHLGPVDPGASNRLPDLALVQIGSGGVDMAISGLQSGAHRIDGILRCRLVDAETDCRNRYLVVECNVRNGHGATLRF